MPSPRDVLLLLLAAALFGPRPVRRPIGPFGMGGTMTIRIDRLYRAAQVLVFGALCAWLGHRFL